MHRIALYRPISIYLVFGDFPAKHYRIYIIYIGFWPTLRLILTAHTGLHAQFVAPTSLINWLCMPSELPWRLHRPACAEPYSDVFFDLACRLYRPACAEPCPHPSQLSSPQRPGRVAV